jgi:hypothetical protein
MYVVFFGILAFLDYIYELPHFEYTMIPIRNDTESGAEPQTPMSARLHHTRLRIWPQTHISLGNLLPSFKGMHSAKLLLPRTSESPPEPQTPIVGWTSPFLSSPPPPPVSTRISPHHSQIKCWLTGSTHTLLTGRICVDAHHILDNTHCTFPYSGCTCTHIGVTVEDHMTHTWYAYTQVNLKSPYYSD